MRSLSMVILLALASAPRTIMAQTGGRLPVWAEISAGSELERYTRLLQLRGLVPRHPWSLRPFSPAELARLAPPDSGHPWAERYAVRRPAARALAAPLRAAATLYANTTFPYGYNDAAVWAGRGLTAALEAGVAARYGPVSLAIAPLAFVSQNAGFRLMDNGTTGARAYADGVYPDRIDLPQRFGADPYAVIDLGQSTLRLDAGGVALGLSTANEFWGPAREYPILLGTNAAGFPRGFLGTSAPVDLQVLRIHARLVWGRLSQSDHSPETEADGLRFGTGAVAVVTSRYVPGLEIGVSRFAHLAWPGDRLSLDHFLYPLRSQRAEHFALVARDNQLSSIFFRWALPRSGFEVYGEYGRDDFWEDLRELAQEPDHHGGYTLGFAKVWGSGTTVRVARAEIHDLQPSVLAQARGVVPFYIHGGHVRQGHTQRGQLLGSYAGFGGAGAIAAFDTYHRGGRWTVSWARVLRRQRGAFAADSVMDPRGLDVMHALTWNALFFRGLYDITAGAALVYEFNRDFRADHLNLNVTVGVRAAWPR